MGRREVRMWVCTEGGWMVDSAEKRAEVSAEAWLYRRRRASAASRRAQSWKKKRSLKAVAGIIVA